ncbi:MFS transporter [Methylobacterium brachythecii]|uniref:Putative tartrate transporter n=1 Tax=Methylobacterium brachythecii TaxID=1176177 RepID=A0A7W6AJG5_9HYPH|nr:MFS transporter [Methylobacterium brachythecii]MBB3903611.1 D-galactonate transporter [Methylobacterium brachythecii]GLS46921.1 MFS transporter [Methylobacterium brachythecii]
MTDALMRKVSWRLLPFLMLCYFVAYLDRVNVGFAALTMNRDLGLSAEAYGFGAGIFFLGYFLFEVPSNVILERVGARTWIARIMISWAILSASTAFVVGERSFVLVRFLLGLAEAGFFPGIILYLTYWYPSERRAGIVGTFMMAVPISAAVGSPLSAWIMAAADGAHGLAGWQWLYLLEAAPSLLLGLAVPFVLTDRPAMASWLTPAERDELAREIERDRQATRRPALGLRQALVHPQVLGLALVYLGLSAGLYGVGLWLPQIVKGFGLSTLETGFVTAIPYLVAAAGMVAWTRMSDRRGERIWHVAFPAFAGALALAVSGQTGSPVPAMALLSLAMLGVFCALPTFWTLPTALLSGSAAAGGIALINAVGGLGGFIGPYLVGWIKDATGRFDLALAAIAALMIAAGLLTLVLGRTMRDG